MVVVGIWGVITRVALQKTSLIDFPARVAAVVFIPGCNFRCPYCHNPQLVRGQAPESLMPVGELLGFLDKRRELVSGVVLSGGEPTIHDDLPRLADAIRKRGLAVKLDTNGSRPDAIAEIRPDYVALDIKTAPDEYRRVAPGMSDAGALLLRSLATLRDRGIPYEIRITCVPGIVGPAEARAVAALVEPDDDVVLQPFRPLKTLDPAWMSVQPYTDEVMLELLAIVRAAAPAARIRGMEAQDTGRASTSSW